MSDHASKVAGSVILLSWVAFLLVARVWYSMPTVRSNCIKRAYNKRYAKKTPRLCQSHYRKYSKITAKRFVRVVSAENCTECSRISKI